MTSLILSTQILSNFDDMGRSVALWLLMLPKRNVWRSPGLTHNNVIMNEAVVENVQFHKHMGVILISKGTWHDHVETLLNKISRRIGLLRSLKINWTEVPTICTAYSRSLLDYCDSVWDNCTEAQDLSLAKIRSNPHYHGLQFCFLENFLQEAGFTRLSERRRQHRLPYLFKIVHGLECEYLTQLLPIPHGVYALPQQYQIPPIRSKYMYQHYRSSFLPSTIGDWNKLPLTLRCSESLSLFKQK